MSGLWLRAIEKYPRKSHYPSDSNNLRLSQPVYLNCWWRKLKYFYGFLLEFYKKLLFLSAKSKVIFSQESKCFYILIIYLWRASFIWIFGLGNLIGWCIQNFGILMACLEMAQLWQWGPSASKLIMYWSVFYFYQREDSLSFYCFCLIFWSKEQKLFSWLLS